MSFYTPKIFNIFPTNGALRVQFYDTSFSSVVRTATYAYTVNGNTDVAFTPTTTSASNKEIVIPGLTNGTSYSIKIKAIISGTGTYESNSVSATPYDFPTYNLVINELNQELKFKYELISTQGRDQLGIQYSFNGQPYTTLTNGQENSFSSLNINQSYLFDISRNLSIDRPLLRNYRFDEILPDFTTTDNTNTFKLITKFDSYGWNAITSDYMLYTKSGTFTSNRALPSGISSAFVLYTNTILPSQNIYQTIFLVPSKYTLSLLRIARQGGYRDTQYLQLYVKNSTALFNNNYFEESPQYLSISTEWVRISFNFSITMLGYYDIGIYSKDSSPVTSTDSTICVTDVSLVRLNQINRSFSASPYTNPDAPVIRNIIPSNQKLTVSFTQTSNGSRSLLFYEYKLNGVDISLNSTESPFDITGLTNGTTYQLQLRGYNGKYSNYSTQLSGIPANVPNQITDTTVTAVLNGMDISFTTPQNNGASITQYQYMIEGHSFNNIESYREENSKIIFTIGNGLVVNTIYRISIKSINAIGESPQSPFVQFTYNPLTSSTVGSGVSVNGSNITFTNRPTTINTNFSFNNTNVAYTIINNRPVLTTTTNTGTDLKELFVSITPSISPILLETTNDGTNSVVQFNQQGYNNSQNYTFNYSGDGIQYKTINNVRN